MPGPFYFHWIGPGALPFDPGFAVNDEEVFAFTIEHDEGDFATLEIEIINPRVGLLNEDREVWAWLSYDRAWQPGAHTPDVRPLFYGRLIGIPEDLQNETVTLHFLARPVDYAQQQLAVAQGLKVSPYWDPIWFAPESRDNPDNVLESRPELWHIDRITHVVSTSNIISGEDGTITLDEDDELYSSMRLGYGSAAVRKVQVKANVTWDQSGTGSIDMEEIVGRIIETHTGKKLAENWPKSGAKLSGGWVVDEGHAELLDGDARAVYGFYHWWQTLFEGGFYSVQVPEWAGEWTFGYSGPGGGGVYQQPPHLLKIPINQVKPTLKLGWDVSRKRSEGIEFILEADVQAILTDPGDEEVMELTFSSSELSTTMDEITVDDSQIMLVPPLGDVRSPRYFSTDRGAQSIEYLIALARSHLLARSRAVNIEFAIPFNRGIDLDLSCRKSVALIDYRLPGGQAAGKITAYKLSCNGDNGELSCEITIGCCIGKGGTVTAVTGDPTYVENGYFDNVQVMDNAYVMPFAGEVNYGSLNGAAITDDGVNLYGMNAGSITKSYVVENNAAQQQAAILAASLPTGEVTVEPKPAMHEVADVFKCLDDNATKVTLTLMPLTGGPFDTQYFIPTSLLSLPKTIDLEAGVVS